MEKKHFTKPLLATCSALLFAAGAYMVDTESAMANSQQHGGTHSDSSSDDQQEKLPVEEIQNIVGAQGHVDNGVLDIEIARTDIGGFKGIRLPTTQ